MKIAIYSDNFYPELSGITDTILTTAKELARRGHLINFFVPAYSKKNYTSIGLEENKVFHENINVTRLQSFSYPTGTGQGRMVIPNGIRAIKLKKFNPDIIHLNVLAGTGIEALIDAKILRKPLVATNHTPITEFIKYSPIKNRAFTSFVAKYNVWLHNQCDFVSSPCQAIFDEMEKMGFNKPHNVIANPLDTKIFKEEKNKNELKKKFGFSKFTLLYTGRLATEKHIDLAIKALASLQKKAPDMDLVIAGKGSEEEKLKQLAKELKVEDKVKFFGYQKSQRDFAEIYNATDLFIMMGTAETQSIAAMNAMATGSPVLAAAAWGLKEYITGENGLLVKPNDLNDLTEKIYKLYQDKDLYNSLSKGGLEFSKKLSIPAIGDIWENTYNEVIKEYAKNHAKLKARITDIPRALPKSAFKFLRTKTKI